MKNKKNPMENYQDKNLSFGNKLKPFLFQNKHFKREQQHSDKKLLQSRERVTTAFLS